MSLKSPYFLGYLFDTDVTSVKGFQAGLQVDGRVTYTVGSAVDINYSNEWQERTQRSFMFGLLVDDSGDAKVNADVFYRDENGKWFPLDKEDALGGSYGIVDQLNANPGTPTARRWIGFSQPKNQQWHLDISGIAHGKIQFDARVRIYPTTGPEFIPFVGRHLRDKKVDGSFAQGDFSVGHMPSMWYVPMAPKTDERGQTRVYGPRGWSWL